MDLLAGRNKELQDLTKNLVTKVSSYHMEINKEREIQGYGK